MNKLLRKIRISVSVSASVLITLIVGLTLTALLFIEVRQVESARQKVQFQQSAGLRTAAIETGLQDAVEQLIVLNQLFRSFGIISKQQFHTFTEPILQRYPQIQALSFQRLVQQADRNKFETEMRKRYPDFTIAEIVDGKRQPAVIRDSYNTVEYIEPSIGNEAAMGLDTAYNDDQTQARKRSRESGRPTSTGLLSLAQDKGWHTGFLVLAPVYWQGVPLDNVAMRVRALIGETAAVFRVDHLIGPILHAHGFTDEPGMTISIYAGENADPKNLAFREVRQEVTDEAVHLPSGWLFYDNMEPLGENFALAD
jgi:CHASE1-domain containing sensor protein